ncbi:F-box protein At2g26850-like [Prosopis cineraria]|uniref:F-box protein At2g26850-like n=1 Tax=Prosopis cineraria TaxID=364024 RepID=UPI0024107500|nr:F-box protein At2g26850-like [Prosopis cineraria]XP_054789548.1 F-box protein At2g26850-like [Prosopis cineraria]
MLLYFITCLSFFLFLKSLHPLKSFPPWASEIRLISLLFYKDLSLISSYKLISQIPSRMCLVNKTPTTKKAEVNVFEEDTHDLSVLDLPDLVLECILERLSPPALCKMAGVCRSLRERCVSDYFWERHMKQKWGRVIGPAAYSQWQCQIASKHDDVVAPRKAKERGLLRFLPVSLWPFSWIRLLKVASNNSSGKQQSSLPTHSVMTWYLALESGSFWFPAQVYNRENGHVGFMLSCYDAELSYDPRTDTFHARYPPHGSKPVAIENGIPWERLRAPPVDTSPRDLHISDCLNDLRPGDHIEIQWRRNKEFPYGWWYGVVGHLESCDGNETYCRCHNSDTIVLEFNQYAGGSRWRRATASRKDHREEGNEADGFYGGIRKIDNVHEISMWKQLWPSEILD